jgi:short-subunit dehydrogenase
VGLVARRRDRLEALARVLPSPSTVHAVDVRDDAAMAHAGREFLERVGVPDVVIANAGVSAGNLTEVEDDLETVRWIFDVNVLGLARTFQPFVEPMRQRKHGQLVGIASVAGIRGMPGAGAYCASKSAAITYLESLRVELRGSGVGVTTILPGYVATAMTEKNPYRMPFMLSADEAARRCLKAVDSGRRQVIVPWQMAIVGRVLRLLPPAVFDAIFVRAGRKPRRRGVELPSERG